MVVLSEAGFPATRPRRATPHGAGAEAHAVAIVPPLERRHPPAPRAREPLLSHGSLARRRHRTAAAARRGAGGLGAPGLTVRQRPRARRARGRRRGGASAGRGLAPPLERGRAAGVGTLESAGAGPAGRVGLARGGEARAG